MLVPNELQHPFNFSISASAWQIVTEKRIMQQTRGMIFTGILLAVVCLIFPDLASAADTNVISNIVQQYHKQSTQIIAVTTTHARKLFVLCATLEIVWLGVNAALGRADMGEIVKKFCITLVVCGFFLAVINNYYLWSQEVVNGLYNKLAGEAVGVHDSSDLAFKKGLELCKDMFAAIEKMDFWDEGGLILLWSFTLLIVLVVFCLITARVIVYKCEALIAMAASCILLGFGGSSVMRDFAMNTLRYILAVGMKLFTMQLVIVTGYQFITNLVMQQPDVPLALTILGCVIVLFFLLNTLPGTVAGLVSSSSGGSGTGMGSMGRTALGAAAAAAAGSYAGARNVGLAMQTARAEGATGIGGTLAGTARTLWQASRESAQDRESRQNTVGSSLRMMLEAARAKNLK